jgi:hypothetical protein
MQNLSWKHAAAVGAGLALPPTFAALEGQAVLSLMTLWHALATAAIVGVAAALQSFLSPAK